MAWQRVRVALGVIALCGFAAYFALPPLDRQLLDHELLASAEFWTQDGALLRVKLNVNGSRCMWRPLAELSPLAPAALIGSEDRNFYSHRGVDSLALLRALKDRLIGGPRSGASTITMQLAKLLAPHQRGPGGKVADILLALRLERSLSKDEILEQYLNRIPLGRGLQGVEAASWAYFGHTAAALSDSEAALLAAIAPAPSRLDPRHARSEACSALARMLNRQGRTQTACPEVRAIHWPSMAPHFVEALGTAGGRHPTSLYSEVQAFAEAALLSHRQRLLSLGIEDGALVAFDVESGTLRALVGSFDFASTRGGQVNGAVAHRQAGSILKPFLYAMFFEAGGTETSIVSDFPRCFREGDGLFCPQNFDGKFHGAVSARVALGSSLNMPAVATLEAIGTDAFSRKLVELGVLHRAEPERHGLGLALGDADVSLLEVTRAFSVFARDGALGTTRVFSKDSAATVARILGDADARRVGFGTKADLPTHLPLLFKTGTSTYGRDMWALGATTHWVVGVWVGNGNGTPTEASAIDAAAPILATLLESLEASPRR